MIVKLREILFGVAVFLAVSVGAALAANPTDNTFGKHGIAEIEAREPGVFEYDDQVGGIVDLERARDGKLLAAVYPIARGGHYFAAARINSNGLLDKSFGQGGFTPKVRLGRGREENDGGTLQAEALAGQRDGDVVLAGYLERDGAFGPALARFTRHGELDPSFGNGGKVVPRTPTLEGHPLTLGAVGGDLLQDVTVEPNGTIVAAGEVATARKFELGPKQPAAFLLAYRPDGKLDRGFGHGGRVEVKAPHASVYTGFNEVEALPSGKLLVSGYVENQIVLYRFTANGRPDRSFGGGDGKVTVGKPTSEGSYAFIRAPFAVDRRGRIVLTGVIFNSSILDSQPVVLVRFSAEGRRDRDFGKSIYAEQARADRRPPLAERRHVEYYHFEPQALAIDGHGRIVVAGRETAPYRRGQQEGGYSYFSARRFLPNGRRDRSFGHGGVSPTNPAGSQSLARAAVTEANGQVVAGGWIQIERGGGNGPGNTAMLLTRYR